MSIENLNDTYWNGRYETQETGWDIGYPSPSFIEYFKNIDRSVKILIPGCGNSYEGEALFNMGFKNITLLDFAPISKANFLKRVPEFPEHQFIVGDFFKQNGKFDFILEQTFFCALNPELRTDYIKQVRYLLKEKGKLVGLLFDAPLNTEHPPFGGDLATYKSQFSTYFTQVKMIPCLNSIVPRAGKELWIEIGI